MYVAKAIKVLLALLAIDSERATAVAAVSIGCENLLIGALPKMALHPRLEVLRTTFERRLNRGGEF